MRAIEFPSQKRKRLVNPFRKFCGSACVGRWLTLPAPRCILFARQLVNGPKQYYRRDVFYYGPVHLVDSIDKVPFAFPLFGCRRNSLIRNHDLDTDNHQISIWKYRLRRRLRNLVKGQPPCEDQWNRAGGSVVVIAPHPDDEVIGCGGTVCRHVEAGDAVSFIYLTQGEKSRGFAWLTPEQRQAKRKQEAQYSSRILGVSDLVFLDGVDGHLSEEPILTALAAKVAVELDKRSPKLIYVPHAEDNHPDHVASFKMITALSQAMKPAPLIYQYELWSPVQADFAVDITAQMPRKIKAIRKHELALDVFDYVETMVGLAAYRSGTMLQRKGYAEAFKLGSTEK